MRRRALIVLLTVVVLLAAAGVTTVVLEITRVGGTPEDVARRYLEAWENGRTTVMRDLVAAPPSDFIARHERFDAALRIESIDLTAGKLTRKGETAELAFTGVRTVGGLGEWRFASTLHLAVRDREWKVLWKPATLHPGLGAGGEPRLAEITVPTVTLTTRDRKDFPKNSGAEKYVEELNRRIAEAADDPPTGWAIEVTDPGGGVRRLAEFRPPPPKRRARTTIDWFTQAAAARALDGMNTPAAIVAVRPSTGEVLAVADRLGDARNAFLGLYPPGSAFEVVTAAALLSAGKVTAGASAACPARYIPRARTFTNADRRDRGTVTFRQAFAHSCDTTFARLAVDNLGEGELWTQASRMGFGARLAPGTEATTCTLRRVRNDRDQLGADATGQGSVRASPLCMALVAAAVQNGTWRPPRLMSARVTRRIQGSPRPAMRLPEPTVAALREMMSAVVTEGTAASAGLPSGTAGKTGTARVGGRTHAWFVGYRGDLAFCALVESGTGGTAGAGGTGGAADATSVVARFLKAL
ncbi:penicillin-binding transpeptidase domain-containing protein [Thermopolyspora sp. NPDC052614]|uniref:penicillin-binding transpeptidase domain-containing protein n=1 Tax=Thermopolyspora sp. NPDC052614 TaxID=3155682 RepID=UPI003419F02C